jgi:hypothetical protein
LCVIVYIESNYVKNILKKKEAALPEMIFSHLNPELNHICHLLALIGAHHILHVSRINAVSTTPVRAKQQSPSKPKLLYLLF